MHDLRATYRGRPFKTRNADEFQLEDLLELFVEPNDGLIGPFEYENNIIKGKMGAGKTMYLRSNFAYYLYSIVPSLLADTPVTLPVFIRLSDFQHLKSAEQIYRGIIIAIVQQLCDLPDLLADAQKLAHLHRGLQSLPSTIPLGPKENVLRNVLKMNADEYTERLSTNLGLRAGAKHKFFEATAEYKRDAFLEVKGKESPGIADIHDAYRGLLGATAGNILLLIDEAGALDRSFFTASPAGSLFETLMNQLRTADYVRTKVAVYPHSYSDILTETRYGDTVSLTEDVRSEDGYRRFRKRALTLMDRYISHVSNEDVGAADVFDLQTSVTTNDQAGEAERDGDHHLAISVVENQYNDLLEQLIYASGGNARRLILLLDQAMSEAFKYTKGQGKVHRAHVEQCLSDHTSATESSYSELDRTFLESIATVCRARGTFKFQFPYKAPVLSKFVTRSEEHNLLMIVDPGSGRRGTVYAFDYCYCCAHDIPTHLVRGTDKIDKTRSLEGGGWAGRVAQISEELVAQAQIPKVSGKITYVGDKGGRFAQGEDGADYYFTQGFVIEQDQNRSLSVGQQVRFYPAKMDAERYAFMVELI